MSKRIEVLLNKALTMGLAAPAAKTIPLLQVKRRNLCEAWEESVLKLWLRGCAVKTQYDKVNDPLSRDCTMAIEVEEPLAEPRLYKAFPGGLVDLWKYRQEVLRGDHDHWVDVSDKTKWDYTYHQRLFGYQLVPTIITEAVNRLLAELAKIPYFLRHHQEGVGSVLSEVIKGANAATMDQIADYLIPKIAETPHSRRIQAITWQPGLDSQVADPPCLQRIWVRILDGKLHLNTHWRSRDAFKAAYMNMYAMIELQKFIAERVSQLRGEEIIVGPYKDISDSYHIYGSDFSNQSLPLSFQGWLGWLSKHPGDISQRAWATQYAIENFDFINEAEAVLAQEKAED